ncbi:MAG TPA: hypothetical protein DDW52_28780, partial [Planctomycetaceae bacterium]|nr:hypothetical protein [Planctomycetaceae bacterium]
GGYGGYGGFGGGLGGELGGREDASGDATQSPAYGVWGTVGVPQSESNRANVKGVELSEGAPSDLAGPSGQVELGQRGQRQLGLELRGQEPGVSGKQPQEAWQFGFNMPEQPNAQPDMTQPAVPQDDTRYAPAQPVPTPYFSQQSAPFYPYPGNQSSAPATSPEPRPAVSQLNYSNGQLDASSIAPSDTPALPEFALKRKQDIPDAIKRAYAEQKSSNWADIDTNQSGAATTASIDPEVRFQTSPETFFDRMDVDFDVDLEQSDKTVLDEKLKELRSRKSEIDAIGRQVRESLAAGRSAESLLKQLATPEDGRETARKLEQEQLNPLRTQLEVFSKQLGEDHPQVAMLGAQVQGLEKKLGEVRESERFFRDELQNAKSAEERLEDRLAALQEQSTVLAREEQELARRSGAAADADTLREYGGQVAGFEDQQAHIADGESAFAEVPEFDDSVSFRKPGDSNSDESWRELAQKESELQSRGREEVARKSRRLADAEKQLQESLSIVNESLAGKTALGAAELGQSLAEKAKIGRRQSELAGSFGDREQGFVDSMRHLDGAASQEALWFARNWDGYQPSAVERKIEKHRQLIERAEPSQALGEISAEQEAFSTFSLHVSDVSFKLAQSALAKDQWPEVGKVRIEEFVNAFDYGDPLPSSDEAVAARVEQCVHPFLQQRNMMRVAMRTSATGRAAQTPLRLTLLVDNSGSMERIDRRQTVVRAFRLLTEQLQPGDQVSLIGFARTPSLLAERVPAEKAVELSNRVATMPSQGGTNIEAALELAYAKAKEQFDASGQNRVILFTDGAVNLGDAEPESLSKIVQQMRESKIAFDAAGISADGLNDEVLEALARKGDGRYYLLDSAESADAGFARQVAGALRPSAKNVKVQVEFNPERVGQYKLLGFEKHQLKKEDFRDDSVDAAELAADEAGVAVYQFEAKPEGTGDIGFVSVRFQDVASGELVERRWPIPYESQPARIEDTTDTMRLAATSALFASKLRGDALGEAVQWKRMFQIASTLSGSQRVAALKQMIYKAADLAR